MADRLVEIADGFWNIRGSFKLGGILDVGTQASLARLTSGGFVVLDSYAWDGEVDRKVKELTNGGQAIEAILNLHPFHTIHVKAMSTRFPNARLYGTARHIARAPDLQWQELLTDSKELHELFSEDFLFTVPRGVDFISSNERLHFSSVLAIHKASRSLHVDDTLTWTPLPLVGGLTFHMTLASVLQKRPGAVAEFRAWAQELIALCEDVDHLCTAHMRPLPPADGESVAKRVRGALAKVEKTLAKHEGQYS